MWWLLLIPIVALTYWLIGYLLLGLFYRMLIVTHRKIPCTGNFKRSACNKFYNQSHKEQSNTSLEYRDMIIRSCSSYNSTKIANLWPINLFKYLSSYKVDKMFIGEFETYFELRRLKKQQAEDEMKISSIVAELRLEGVANLTPAKFDVLMDELESK